MIEWRVFEHKVAEFFKDQGYIVNLNEKVVGNSGISYEVDVLALDKNFSEIKIACQCKSQKDPVDRDQILLWAKTCEDIHAIPAFASTSGYSDSAIKIAEKLGFILLSYDEETNVIYKIGAKEKALPLIHEETDELIFQAKQLIQKAGEIAEQLNQLYTNGIEDKEKEEKLKAEIESTFKQAISLYNEALKRKSDKYKWLELGQLMDFDYNGLILSCFVELGEEKERLYKKQSVQCYLKALEEHLKEFPEVLKILGTGEIPTLSSFLAEESENSLLNIFATDYGVKEFQIYLLRTYLQAQPNDAKVWLRLAEHYIDIGEIDKAERACEKALEVDSNNIGIITRSCYIYERIIRKTLGERKLHFINKVIELLKRRCELEPDSPRPYRKLADIYSTFSVEKDKRTRIDKAIYYMEEALKRDKNPSWYSWKMLGDLYFEKGDKEKAFECYSKAIEIKNQR